MIKSLTGIRFYLFLFILINHIYTNIILKSDMANIFPCGFWGSYAVLFFFILSGFCIAINNTDKFNNLSFEEIKNFCFKRVVKFYPLYIITGLICLIFHYLPMSIKWLNAFIFLYIPMLQPFSPWKHGAGNGTAWFLAVLFFCYIFTPLILFLFNKLKSLKGLLISYFVIYGIMILFSLIQLKINPSNDLMYDLYHFPPLRLFHYLTGIVIGIIYVKHIKNNIMLLKNSFAKSCLDILVIGIFIAGLFYDLKTSNYSTHYGASLPFEQIICIPLFSLIILYLCNSTKSILSYILDNKLIMYLGSISFECYLIHYVFIIFMKDKIIQYANSYFNILIIVLVILSLSIFTSALYKKITQFIFSKNAKKEV